MNGTPVSIKFLHPGGERILSHSEIATGIASWNTMKHSRKYVEAKGKFMSAVNSIPVEDILGFWTEWEAPSKIVRVTNSKTLGYPCYVHTPLHPTAPVSHQYKNTDPCVFGEYFLYSNCQQYTSHGKQATVLQNLEPGDIIVFGSHFGGLFVVDTVFVVKDVVPINRRQVRTRSIQQVPQWYYDLTLDFLVNNHVLYIGATPSQPYKGMFSFFPCVSAVHRPRGFNRPATLHQTNSKQVRGFRYKGLGNPQSIWNQVVQDTLSAGLLLGVNAKVPDPIIFNGNINNYGSSKSDVYHSARCGSYLGLRK
ncbi:hypothetical protein [Bacillus toyonensis]|uniref:hypothetical protein n=1 Tax=Bacillus toyonensis TaxID=155322 RepID=UPI002E1D84F9|nr:hypothetical protein [Bacillus toyonensis]